MQEKVREARSLFIVGVSAIEEIMGRKSLSRDEEGVHIAELYDDPRGHLITIDCPAYLILGVHSNFPGLHVASPSRKLHPEQVHMRCGGVAQRPSIQTNA